MGYQGLAYSSKARLFLVATSICCVAVNIAADQSSKHSKAKAKNVLHAQAAPACVAPTGTANQSSVATFSAHTVALSWGASVPSPDHAKADGYCLYRSKTQNDAKLEKDCKECELLTQKPISGTACIDNTVIDSQTYYYAVAGVNAAGMSGASNEVSAFIRTDKPASSPAQGIPFCGATPSPQSSPSTSKK